jgi:hypothetical protein
MIPKCEQRLSERIVIERFRAVALAGSFRKIYAGTAPMPHVNFFAFGLTNDWRLRRGSGNPLQEEGFAADRA